MAGVIPPEMLGEPRQGGRVRRINPVAAHLADGGPNAEFILWGAEDTAKARIHASDESVDPQRSRR
jgi:hypothetical protein